MGGPGTMLLMRIFMMVSPWEPVFMRLRRDRARHGNTARAQLARQMALDLAVVRE